MRRIKYITIHCTAGYGTIASIKKFWHEKLGWKTGGYHRIVDLDAKINKLYDFSVVTNGVKGFNPESIHISYTGGVEPDNVNKAKDSRTDAQKEAIISCIEEALLWCKQYQKVDGALRSKNLITVFIKQPGCLINAEAYAFFQKGLLCLIPHAVV